MKPFHKTTMMTIGGVLLLAGVSFSAFTQEAGPVGGAMTLPLEAVFLVNQSIYLDADKVGNLELFRKLEEALGRKVLNQFIPVASGTAFLVNKNGSLITAAHVVANLPDGKKNENGFGSFHQFVSKNILPGYMTRRELHFIFVEYRKLVKKSEIVISVKSSARKDYRARVVEQNRGLDLALLKIDLDEPIAPLPVNDAIEYNVGDEVISIGYPLPFIMDQFLDDLTPTVTNGIISALRTDAWDIQHSASINPGNSGGPLLSRDGRLLGVNVGAVTEANNIYFATNAGKLVTWLKQVGKAELINDN